MILKAYTDGASKGNPGPAAIGYVIEKDGNVIEEHSEFIGIATNNIAEYKALITALIKMKSLGATDVFIFSDSELMVRQINKIYKVKNERLKPFFFEADNLLKSFDSCEIIHIPREKNSVADGLANKAFKNI
jgi:ribonuclease HI